MIPSHLVLDLFFDLDQPPVKRTRFTLVTTNHNGHDLLYQNKRGFEFDLPYDINTNVLYARGEYNGVAHEFEIELGQVLDAPAGSRLAARERQFSVVVSPRDDGNREITTSEIEEFGQALRGSMPMPE